MFQPPSALMSGAIDAVWTERAEFEGLESGYADHHEDEWEGRLSEVGLACAVTNDVRNARALSDIKPRTMTDLPKNSLESAIT